MTAPAGRLSRAELCTRTEAAEILGCHPNTIDRLGREKTLKRYGIRGMKHTILYSRDEVANCIHEIDDEDVA